MKYLAHTYITKSLVTRHIYAHACIHSYYETLGIMPFTNHCFFCTISNSCIYTADLCWFKTSFTHRLNACHAPLMHLYNILAPSGARLIWHVAYKKDCFGFSFVSHCGFSIKICTKLYNILTNAKLDKRRAYYHTWFVRPAVCTSSWLWVILPLDT